MQAGLEVRQLTKYYAATPALRVRVMSVYLLVMLGGQALGGPCVGWLIDHYGARASMFGCGSLPISDHLDIMALQLEIECYRRCDFRIIFNNQNSRH